MCKWRSAWNLVFNPTARVFRAKVSQNTTGCSTPDLWPACHQLALANGPTGSLDRIGLPPSSDPPIVGKTGMSAQRHTSQTSNFTSQILRIGIDLGGSKIEGALMSSDGAELARCPRSPSPATGPGIPGIGFV